MAIIKLKSLQENERHTNFYEVGFQILECNSAIYRMSLIVKIFCKELNVVDGFYCYQFFDYFGNNNRKLKTTYHSTEDYLAKSVISNQKYEQLNFILQIKFLKVIDCQGNEIDFNDWVLLNNTKNNQKSENIETLNHANSKVISKTQYNHKNENKTDENKINYSDENNDEMEIDNASDLSIEFVGVVTGSPANNYQKKDNKTQKKQKNTKNATVNKNKNKNKTKKSKNKKNSNVNQNNVQNFLLNCDDSRVSDSNQTNNKRNNLPDTLPIDSGFLFIFFLICKCFVFFQNASVCCLVFCVCVCSMCFLKYAILRFFFVLFLGAKGLKTT